MTSSIYYSHFKSFFASVIISKIISEQVSSFFTKEAMTNIAHTTLQNVKDFVEGRPLVNEVAVGRV